MIHEDSNHLIEGQTLYASNGEEVILRKVSSEYIVVEYKGKLYSRNKTVLGNKLFVENPLVKTKSDSNKNRTETVVENKTTFDNDLYVGRILYTLNNKKCTIVAVSKKKLTISVEHLVNVFSNYGLNKEVNTSYEIQKYSLLDIGTKLFFEPSHISFNKQEILNDRHYSRYLLFIKDKVEAKENEQISKIQRYSPNIRMTPLQKQLIIDSYYYKEENLKEELKFRKDNENGEFFARLDIDTYFHDVNNLFKEHYYIKAYLSKKPIGKLTRLNRDDIVWQINSGLYTKYPGDISRSQFWTLAEWEKPYYIESDIVIDWRAPVADLYFSNDKAELCINDVQTYEHNLMLKRRFENNDFQDLYISGDNLFVKGSVDPFLIKILNENKSVHNLSDIIRTIQSNQNDIIRSPIEHNIIVQGCAGSGKTMILLHRLSYLLYNNTKLEKRRIKILTPTDSFNLHINELSISLELNDIERITVENYYFKAVQSFDKQLHTSLNFQSELAMDQEFVNYIYSDKFIETFKLEYNSYLSSLIKFEILDTITKKYRIKVIVQEKLNNHEKIDEFKRCIKFTHNELLKIIKLITDRAAKNKELAAI